MKLDPFSSGVLDKQVHARLVADLDNIAMEAPYPAALDIHAARRGLRRR